MGSRQNLDCLGACRISSDPAVVLSIGPNYVGQDLCVTWVRFGAGGDVAITIATGGKRVDSEDLVPARHQALDQQAPIGLDTDDHLSCIGSMATDQLLDVREALEAVCHAAFGQHLTVRSDDTDVMVPLTPIDANEDHAASLVEDDRA